MSYYEVDKYQNMNKAIIRPDKVDDKRDVCTF